MANVWIVEEISSFIENIPTSMVHRELYFQSEKNFTRKKTFLS